MSAATGPAVVRSRRVVLADGVRPAAVHIADGRITAITAWDDVPALARVDDVGELALLPGIVDTHVHLNEPGRTEWEGFATATAAAAAGGTTTLVDMPLNSIPPTTTREALAQKRAAARGQCAVDVGFCRHAVDLFVFLGNQQRSPGKRQGDMSNSTEVVQDDEWKKNQKPAKHHKTLRPNNRKPSDVADKNP